jgi:hypothetical protein
MILEALDLKTARLLLDQGMWAYETRSTKAMTALEAVVDDATAVLAFDGKLP